jgi:hypothetical protein
MKPIPSAARRIRHGIVLAVIGGIVASGCGSDSGSGDDPASTTSSAKGDETAESQDACDMISDEIAADILGVKIVRREPHGQPGGQSVSCIKGLERSKDPKGFTYVNASVISGGVSVVDEAAGQQGSKPVSGLGDRAIFMPKAGTIFIVTGGDLVQVQVVKAGVPGTRQQCVTLAEDVLDHVA